MTASSLLVVAAVSAQTTLPDAPSATQGNTVQFSLVQPMSLQGEQASSSQAQALPQDKHGDVPPPPQILQQQKRVFGVLPNYTSVSGGTRPKPAGWKTDSAVAWKQSTDYVGLIYTFSTSAVAFGQDTHPSLDTVNGGNAPVWAYMWRGLLDRTDQTALGTLLFPALLHQDTRYYAMGTGSKVKRTLHAAESVVIAHSYSGRPVFNVAGLAGKVGAQAVSTTYYPAGSEDFGVLASKFTYACLRQAGFTILREFSPDIAQHLHRHHAKR
ncbi:MAG: hypothetical protein ACRYF4_11670 [Janthinobacterium lividum]